MVYGRFSPVPPVVGIEAVMLTHRFRELFEVATPSPAFAGVVGNVFVACPVACFALTQQTLIRDIYQLAAERTRLQLAPPSRPFRIPEFSAN